MALSITETDEGLELRDEDGTVIQSFPKGSLSPAVEEQYRQYPTYKDPSIPQQYGKMLGRLFEGELYGAKKAAQAIGTPVVRGVAEASRGFGEGMGWRKPETIPSLTAPSTSPPDIVLTGDPLVDMRNLGAGTRVPQVQSSAPSAGVPALGSPSNLYANIRKGANIDVQAQNAMASTEAQAIQERSIDDERRDEERTNQIQAINERFNAADKALQALQDFEFTTNKKGIIKGQDTGTQVGRSFGVALGLLTVPLTGRNLVSDYYNRELLREKSDEMSQFNKVKRGADVALSRLGLIVNHGINIEAAEKVLEADFWGRKQREINNIANQYQSPKIKQNAEIMISQIEQQRQAAIQATQIELAKEVVKAQGASKMKPLAAEGAGRLAFLYPAYLDAQRTQLSGVDWNLLGTSEKKQARERRAEVISRVASGAVIKDSERKKFVKQYVPEFTDSGDEVDKKNRAFNEWAVTFMTGLDPYGRYREIISSQLPQQSLPRSGSARAIASGQEPTNVDRLFQPKR